MNNRELQQIFERFYHTLYLFALSLTHHPQDAEDLVMDTILKAAVSYTGQENIQAWLFRVLKNRFVDRYRKEKMVVYPRQEFIERIRDPGPETRKILRVEEERRLWLYRQIYTLPHPECDVMILSLTSGLKDEEIAEMLDLTVSNLRVIRHRTKQKLKTMAEEEEV